MIAWDLCIVKTFATTAIQGYILVPKDVVDEFIHLGFLKFATISALARKFRRAFNTFSEEIGDIYAQRY